MKRDPNCLHLIETGATVKPDADVSGIGVIIAFIFSAYATLLATLIAYGFGLVDEGLLRPVDRLVLRVPSRAARHVRLHVTLRKIILALSDQQIVTGIAILGAGFQGLRTGQINVYHFQTVIYLAWMSSSVHLSALTLLRPFLHYHRGLMSWRIVGMFVLLIMLLIALVPTVSNYWGVVSIYLNDVNDAPKNSTNSVFGVSANCFWGTTWGSGANPDAVLSFLVLIISYIWKMGGLFLGVRKRFGSLFRSPLDHWLESLIRAPARCYEKYGGRRWLWTFRLCLAVYLPLTALLETLASFFAALWLSTLGVIYGTMQILIPRALVQNLDDNLYESESTFGFGQLVPLILLVQPLGAATEHLWNHANDEGLYADYGGRADPYGGGLGTYHQGGEILGLPDKPLLQFMAGYQTPPLREQGQQRIQLRALLYTSRLFHALVWCTQLAVAITAVVVFVADYQTIGYVSTNNWYFIAFGVAAWLGACPTLTVLFAPISRLGKYYKRDRNNSTAAPGQQDGLPSEGHQAIYQEKMNELGITRTSGASVELPGRDGEVWASELRRKSQQHQIRPSIDPPQASVK